MRTPPRQPGQEQQQQRFGRLTTTNNGELSVICDDIQLSSGGGGGPAGCGVLDARLTPGGTSSGSSSTSGKKRGRRPKAGARAALGGRKGDDAHSSSGRGSTRVSLEEPPDSWSGNGSGACSLDKRAHAGAGPHGPVNFREGMYAEPGRRKAVELTAIGVGTILIRACAPWLSLDVSRMHPNLRPILAPGQWFYLLMIPALGGQLSLVANGYLKPAARDNSVWRHGGSGVFAARYIPLAGSALDCTWIWLITREGTDVLVGVALSVAIVNVLLALVFCLHVNWARRANVAGVWHLKTRFQTRLTDYWALEFPASVQLAWTAIALVVNIGYYLIYDFVKGHDLEEIGGPDMASRQMLATFLTLTLLTLYAAGAFAAKRRTNVVPAFMGALVFADWADLMSQVPDFSASPQLAFIDPDLFLFGLRTTCSVLASCFLALGCCGLALQVTAYRERRKQVRATTDGTYSFVGGRSLIGARTIHAADLRSTHSANQRSGGRELGRRPSEFLMVRSNSSDQNSCSSGDEVLTIADGGDAVDRRGWKQRPVRGAAASVRDPAPAPNTAHTPQRR